MAFLGIDISKKTFHAALLHEEKIKHKAFDNNEDGFNALLAWLTKQGVNPHFCLEATGSYGEALAYYFYNKKFTLSVVNPAKIKGFAQCQLMRLKNDKADAALIAHYCASMKPKPWQPEPEHIRQLQAFVRRVDELVIALKQEENRLAVAPPVIHPSLMLMIETLNNQIKTLQKQIETHINEHPDLSQQAQLLDSIPGVGPATIAQTLAFIGNPARVLLLKEKPVFLKQVHLLCVQRSICQR